ncbi:MAG: class I SAM-dependent methyltransferase [Sulfuricellaceae bacterium]
MPALEEISAWVARWAPHIAAGGRVLDVACGGGRHARYLASRGLRVEAVDIDIGAAAAAIRDMAGVTLRQADLEGGAWPYGVAEFDAVVVTRYLHRPLFPLLLEGLAAGGVLIYETFAAGNERFGRPRNPDFLLRPGELLDRVHGRLRVVAYEEGVVKGASVVQRICAVKPERELLDID